MEIIEVTFWNKEANKSCIVFSRASAYNPKLISTSTAVVYGEAVLVINIWNIRWD